MGKAKLRDAKIVQRLPDIFGRYDEVPKDIFGATIVNFGSFKQFEGSLVIEYIPSGKYRARRAVLGFDDCAMYVTYLTPPEEDDEPGGDIDWGDGGPLSAS